MRPLVLIFLALSMSTPANAITVYRENFLGETGFPTTPEVDPTGMGGLSPFVAGDGPPPIPIVDGIGGTVTLAAASSLGPAGESASVVVGGGSFGPSLEFFQVGGTFQNFSRTFNGIGAVQANVSVVDDLLTASVVAILGDGSDGDMSIIVLEQAFAGTSNDQLRVTLPDSVRVAILGGASFDIELLVDRQLGTATASLGVGSDVFATPELTLTRLGSNNIGVLTSSSLVLDFVDDPNFGGPMDFGADDSVSVQLVELWAAVPEPSTGLLVSLGLVWLVGCRRKAVSAPRLST